MPRPTNFGAFIRNIVREQVNKALQGLLSVAGPRKKAATERGRHRRSRRGRRCRGRCVVDHERLSHRPNVKGVDCVVHTPVGEAHFPDRALSKKG